MNGADELRAAVAWSNGQRESLFDKLTAEQVLALYRASCKSKWDFWLDDWSPRQIREALEGRVPTWTEVDGKVVPTYDIPESDASIARRLVDYFHG